MKTTKNFRGLMKALALIGLLVAFVLIVQKTQAQKKDPGASGNKTQKNQPDVRIKVTKQKDKYGNIIRYDSTYVSTWSGKGNMPANIDSVFKSMHAQFFNGELSSNGRFFQMPSAFNDSDFFSDNYGAMVEQDFSNFENFFRNNPMMDKFLNEAPLPKARKELKPKSKEIKKDSVGFTSNGYVTVL